MEENLDKYIGIAFSRKMNKVYCTSTSEYFKTNLKTIEDIEIAHLTLQDYRRQMMQNPNISHWNIEDILAKSVRLS